MRNVQLANIFFDLVFVSSSLKATIANNVLLHFLSFNLQKDQSIRNSTVLHSMLLDMAKRQLKCPAQLCEMFS